MAKWHLPLARPHISAEVPGTAAALREVRGTAAALWTPSGCEGATRRIAVVGGGGAKTFLARSPSSFPRWEPIIVIFIHRS